MRITVTLVSAGSVADFHVLLFVMIIAVELSLLAYAVALGMDRRGARVVRLLLVLALLLAVITLLLFVIVTCDLSRDGSSSGC